MYVTNISQSQSKKLHITHLSGKYLGATCQFCNVRMKQPINQLPVVFHNLCGYDGHFLINALAESSCCCRNLSPIMQSSEKFITLTAFSEHSLFRLCFIDSYAFLSASLDEIVKSIPPADLKLTTTILCQCFPQLSDAILHAKGFLHMNFYSMKVC